MDVDAFTVRDLQARIFFSAAVRIAALGRQQAAATGHSGR
jgi:hypothetical protein